MGKRFTLEWWPNLNPHPSMKTVKLATDWNLDDENEVDEFIRTHGTTKGLALAKSLGLCGPASCYIANNLSAYAWNKRTASECRKRGDISGAEMYESICDRIYSELPHGICW